MHPIRKKKGERRKYSLSLIGLWEGGQKRGERETSNGGWPQKKRPGYKTSIKERDTFT